MARRTGTSRPVIYRRWPPRAALVLDAISARLEVSTPPDTGCTLCDIGENFQVFLNAYRNISPAVLSALYADCAAVPALLQQYLDTVIDPARRVVGSLVHYRAMFKPDHLTQHEAEQAIEILLQGAAKDYSALVAHSEALEAEHTHH